MVGFLIPFERLFESIETAINAFNKQSLHDGCQLHRDGIRFFVFLFLLGTQIFNSLIAEICQSLVRIAQHPDGTIIQFIQILIQRIVYFFRRMDFREDNSLLLQIFPVCLVLHQVRARTADSKRLNDLHTDFFVDGLNLIGNIVNVLFFFQFAIPINLDSEEALQIAFLQCAILGVLEKIDQVGYILWAVVKWCSGNENDFFAIIGAIRTLMFCFCLANLLQFVVHSSRVRSEFMCLIYYHQIKQLGIFYLMQTAVGDNLVVVDFECREGVFPTFLQSRRYDNQRMRTV